MNRHELAAALKVSDTKMVSNLKFFNLVTTRLVEEGFPHEDALLIAKSLEFDFSNVPEDNDILTQIATEYAEYAGKVWTICRINGITELEYVLKYFQPPVSLYISEI